MAPTSTWPPPSSLTPLAVLCSGGLDSAILLGEALRAYPAVIPIYVRTGLFWEETERAYLDRYLKAVARPNLMPLVTVNQPVRDLYAKHWSVTGIGVPTRDSSDSETYLPGRNLLIFTKPLLWCLANGIPELATAPLGSNPFPDATPEFYDALAALAGVSANGKVRVLRPYAEMGLQKADVLRRGAGLPLEHTLSCLRPVKGLHCGVCNKCGERMQGFRNAGIRDPIHSLHSLMTCMGEPKGAIQ